MLTRFGKFLRVAEAGLNWKAPYLDTVAGIVSLRVNQITLTMETKTKDNVFVTIPISVQNRVRPEKVYDAFYKLSDPMQQIQAYVEQVILGHVPGMTLDEVFASQSGNCRTKAILFRGQDTKPECGLLISGLGVDSEPVGARRVGH